LCAHLVATSRVNKLIRFRISLLPPRIMHNGRARVVLTPTGKDGK
jgi:hypothetical protein